MKNARQIVAEALNLGDDPDFIDPDKRRRIEGGEDPYSGGQAVPPELHELIASEAYRELIRKVQRYTGVRPRGRQDMFQLMHMMQDSAMQVMRIERGHERRLEQAAVALVLGLPEFRSAKAAVEQGNLKIIAQLRPQGVDLPGAQLDPEEEDEAAQAELEIAEIAQEMNLEAEKRRFVNTMIQGNAMHKNYAFHMADELLNGINPRLMNLYGTLMSLGELMYWAVPEQMQAAMMGGGGGHGAANIEQDEEGVPTIRAQAIVFPLLVQELTKGLMEYLSHSDDEDPETRKRVQNKTDTLRNELWDTMRGPAVWKRVVDLIGPDNQEFLPHIYSAIINMPPQQFIEFAKGMMRGSAEARQFVQRIAQEAKDEAGGGPDEPYRDSAGGDDTGGDDEGKADWWKKESGPTDLVNRLLG